MSIFEKDSTSKSSVPKWMESAGKDIYGRANTFSKTPYQSYSGDRVADFSSDTTAGFGKLRDYISNAPTYGGEAAGMVRQASSATGPRLSAPGRLVDEGGALGKISDYMDPNIEATLAPTIRGLEKVADKDRIRVGDMAQGAGGYNDARHGLLEQGVNQDLYRAVGDVTGKAYSDAYNNAMDLRGSDRAASMGVDEANAGFETDALTRLFQGADSLMGTEAAADSTFFGRLQALLSSGTAQQTQAQTELDVPYTEFEKGKQDQYDKLAALISVLGGVPYTRTTTESDGGGGAGGFLGSLLGAL